MKRCALLVSLIPALLFAQPPEIHTISGKYGMRFQHFEFQFTPENTVLPGDPRLTREPLDESSENFTYGQFEVFIPAEKLTLEMGCKRFYIVRMPMTLDRGAQDYIREKQDLFRAIKNVVVSKSGSVRAVIEITTGYEEGCNLFFRDGPRSKYIDYVGPIKR